MARHLRRSPQLRSADAQLLLDVTKETTAAEAAARRLVQRRPEWFVAVLPGPFFEPCKDLFGEGFPIFAEIQVESEVISIFARNCVGDAVFVDAPYEIPPAENVKVLQHRAPSAAAKAAGGEAAAKAAAAAAEASPASTFYFELAEKLKYQVPTFVFWCEGRSLATACGANARAPEHLSLAVGSSCVELFFFHPDALPPAATPSPRGGGVAVSGQLILAPTGSGKSTWRSLAPIYCPEGEVMADVTFHPSYHKSIRLAPGAWLSSEGTAIFLRSLAQLIRWLRQDRRRWVTFNCTGQVLSKALELGILRPSDVVLVLPLEPIHRRNLQRRSAAEPVETNDQATSQPAKKFKRDSSLLDFDTGARINRETLLEAARQHQLRVVSSFTAAAPATRSYCFLRRDDATGRTLRDPGAKLRQAFDLTMPCGRRISNWVLKDGKVEEAENPSIWQISASADRDVEEGAYIVKTLSGFLLLTDGETLISAEDPYREAEEVFWRREAAISESEAVSFILSGPSGTRLHAMRCDGCTALGEAGPWPEIFPLEKLSLPEETLMEGSILWYPGSFAPFHLGHLNCLRAAWRGLQSELNLLGAYVQPQPFGHLAYKKLEDQSSILATDLVRLRILELIISKEDWVMLDPFAILRGKGSNLEHLRALRGNMSAAMTHLTGFQAGLANVIEIIWVMGDDAFPHFREKFLDPHSWHSKQMEKVLQDGKFRLCVVHNRPSQRTLINSEALPFQVLEIDAPPQLSADLSATALRNAWLSRVPESEISQRLGSAEAANYMCSLHG